MCCVQQIHENSRYASNIYRYSIREKVHGETKKIIINNEEKKGRDEERNRRAPGGIISLNSGSTIWAKVEFTNSIHESSFNFLFSSCIKWFILEGIRNLFDQKLSLIDDVSMCRHDCCNEQETCSYTNTFSRQTCAAAEFGTIGNFSFISQI